MMPLLTRRQTAATNLRMPHLFSFLLGLVLALAMGLGTAASATDRMCMSGMESSIPADVSDGDCGQIPTDAKKACPHQHGGCHGHQLAVPYEAVAAATVLVGAERHGVGVVVPTAAMFTDPALRPPIA